MNQSSTRGRKLSTIFALVVAVTMFHLLRNQAFCHMGYWIPTSSQLQNQGNHFSKNGVLEADFHYKAPGGQESLTYSLRRVGDNKAIVHNAFMGSTSLKRGTWGEFRFPVTPGNAPLKLSTGKYVIKLMINGKTTDAYAFYVDKPITANP